MLPCCTCGCVPTVCWAKGFVAFLPVLCSPAVSGYAGSCGFSSPVWFTTFAMGSPLRSRGWFVLDRYEGLVCFLFPFGLFLHVVTALRDIVTIWVRCVGRFPLMPRPTVVAGASPFLLLDGLRPLSEASLRAPDTCSRTKVVLGDLP